MARYQFISGLPRSGSTLLAAILRQNPAFEASVMSPVGMIFTNCIDGMGLQNESRMFIDESCRLRILRCLFDAYYAGIKASTVFDTNRRWCANASILHKMYPDSKIICMVRNPVDIVNSFERVFQAGLETPSTVYGGTSNTTIYQRVQTMMGPSGVIGYALNAFREVHFGPNKDMLYKVEFDDLVKTPRATMRDLHSALSLPEFTYDFENIEQIPGMEAFDYGLATPGLHIVRRKVAPNNPKVIIPPDIYKAVPAPFWR